jgi:hypothetical protein
VAFTCGLNIARDSFIFSPPRMMRYIRIVAVQRCRD